MQFGAFFMFLLRLVYFGISAELRQSDRCDRWSEFFSFFYYFPDRYRILGKDIKFHSKILSG